MPRKTKQDRSAYNRAYREAHYVELRKKQHEWYLANREIVSEKNKAYKAAMSPEERRERRRPWDESHKAREAKRYHATRIWLPWLNSFRGSKQRAKRENIPFTITKEWAIARWTGKCEVTGIEFVLSTSRNPYLFSPSLDRIVPSLGYTPDNSRFVLHAVNALKGAGTDTDMLKIATAIVRSLTPQNCALEML
jgi:hypothetical protein